MVERVFMETSGRRLIKAKGSAALSSHIVTSSLIKVSACEKTRVWTPSLGYPVTRRFITQPPRRTWSQFPLIAQWKSSLPQINQFKVFEIHEMSGLMILNLVLNVSIIWRFSLTSWNLDEKKKFHLTWTN